MHDSFTCEELKKAYRNKSKQFHPDRNRDSLKSHLAMVRLNQAYSHLLKEAGENRPPRKETPVLEEDYSIYRKGIDKFQEIHPSKWKTISRDGLFDAAKITTHPDAPGIIQSIITGMAEAYRCFSIVISEYEGSPWYSDSLQKLREIEKMTVRYIKIKESYERETGKKQR